MTNATSTSNSDVTTPDAHLETSPADHTPTLGPIRIVRAVGEEMLDAAAQYVMWRTQEDYGYGHIPEWHWDMDAARDTYEHTPRQALWVALTPIGEGHTDAASDPTPGTLAVTLPGQPTRERIVGTTAIRAGGPKGDMHPPELIATYRDPATTAQIVRVMIAPEARRRGIASRFVAIATAFTREAGYERLYLHTNALVSGALEFWRRYAEEVYDARGTEYDADPRFETVHFEIPLHA